MCVWVNTPGSKATSRRETGNVVERLECKGKQENQIIKTKKRKSKKRRLDLVREERVVLFVAQLYKLDAIRLGVPVGDAQPPIPGQSRGQKE